MTCTRIFLGILSVTVLATPARAAQATPSCEEWNTKEYFQTATVENVTACLDAGADPMAPNAAGETPWDLAKANKALKGSDAYWRLNEARFEAPGGGAHRSPTKGQTPTSDKSNVELAAAVPSSGPGCMIAGYPGPPGGVANLGFSWCPASVTLQVRSFALRAAGAQCAIATGSSSTPEQINARRQEIKAACDRLAALGVSNCRCPPGFDGPGYSEDSSSIDREKERREQRAKQQEEARQAAERERQARQEEARQAAQREKRRIAAKNAEVLNSDCSCIGIDKDNGEYTCLDGFVGVSCDILR